MERYKPFFNHKNFKKLLEWIEDIKSNDDLLEELKIIYEWEYKYSQLKQSINIKNEKRIQNVLKTINIKLKPILNSVSDKIQEVFANWLKQHALTSANTWATARVKEFDEMVGDYEYILSAAAGEYKRYNGNPNIFYENAFIVSFEEFSDLIYDIKYEIVSADEDELENTEDKEERKDIQQRIDYINDLDITTDAKEALEFLENYLGQSAEEFLNQNATEDSVVAIYEKVVFPVWFKHWKKEGIVQTRKKVQQVYKDLKKSKTESDLQKKIMYINIALNTSHQTGSMMDYIEQEHNISQSDLDELSDVSDSDLKAWNKEVNQNI